MKDFLRIGEVSKLCGVSIKTLRFYEEEGLIKPVEVDLFTGYRHYDQNNIETLYKIQFLKDLGFSLKEIKNFDENSLSLKSKEIENKIKKFRENLSLINFFNKKEGEKKMEIFINDPQVIGKWKYVASCESKEKFFKGDFAEEKNIFLKELYFLPNGKGYWIFNGWTKGKLYHYRNLVYPYEIEKGKLFLYVQYQNKFEICLVFEKENTKEYDIEDIKIKDNTEYVFENNKDAIGYWESADIISFKEKENYTPQKQTADKKDLFVQSLTLSPNGSGIMRLANKDIVIYWTKNKIINKNNATASDFIIKEINGNKYFIMDWKSGDYTFAGMVQFCYVLIKKEEK